MRNMGLGVLGIAFYGCGWSGSDGRLWVTTQGHWKNQYSIGNLWGDYCHDTLIMNPSTLTKDDLSFRRHHTPGSGGVQISEGGKVWYSLMLLSVVMSQSGPKEVDWPSGVS